MSVPMPCSIDGSDLQYFPVPKAACTSVKFAILAHNLPEDAEALQEEMDTRAELRSDPGKVHLIRQRPKMRSAHDYYPTKTFRARYPLQYARRRWFCVVRDPLKRFLSAFSNRIGYHDDLRHSDPAAFGPGGLNRHPDLDEFVARLEAYCRVSGLIHHHIRPMHDYLGTRPARFDRIFPMAGLDGISAYCAEAGAAIDLPHHQRGGSKLVLSDLSTSARRRLESYYAKDYRIWGDHLEV